LDLALKEILEFFRGEVLSFESASPSWFCNDRPFIMILKSLIGWITLHFPFVGPSWKDKRRNHENHLVMIVMKYNKMVSF
jgi:hypothetical protein